MFALIAGKRLSQNSAKKLCKNEAKFSIQISDADEVLVIRVHLQN